ncbi:MAG: helix-turn-helix transcriptional regulator [Clostridia bacterium]|nr:helix-turn-helix transcriptional regulator [Clostridia bacterium]
MSYYENRQIINPDTLHEIENRRRTSAFPFYCYDLRFGEPGNPLVLQHWHSEMEIFYTHAHGILHINDRQYDVVPGDILFINPASLHHSSRRSPGSMFHIVFDLKLLTNPWIESDVNTVVNDLIRRKKQILVKPDRDSGIYRELEPLIRGMTEYHDRVISAGQDICRITSALFEMMSVLYRGNCFTGTDENNLSRITNITKIVDYIKQNYKSQISVGDIAAHMNLSEGYIYNLFRAYMGNTPVGYINSLRIREAYKLLLEGMSITRTASEVGFINVSYFIKIFRNTTGLTPRSWLDSQKREFPPD